MTMTVQELADYLRLAPNHVRSMAAGGRIPEDAIIKPPGSRKYIFDRKKIIEWARYEPRRRRERLASP